jgi:hypothetical protein
VQRIISKVPTRACYRAHRLPLGALTLATLGCAGCDPVIDIAGADFPSWLICMIAGIALAAALRALFAATRIEPHLGPLTVVYPCLALLLSCVVWMIFFNRI